jgi:hypothetical protein
MVRDILHSRIALAQKKSKLKEKYNRPEKTKAMFGSWILEGKGGEGKAWKEINPCL